MTLAAVFATVVSCAPANPAAGGRVGAGLGAASGSGVEAVRDVGEESCRRLVVGSFNIHYVAPGQDRLNWQDRRESVTAMLEDAAPDLMGFQEMETFEGGSYNEENRQLDWIAEHFLAYAFAAVGDVREYPSTQPIMYRRDRLDALAQGFFFFSPTPEEIYSRSWDGGFPAFASWVRFRDRRNHRTFYVYNVHLDHSSRGNRVKAAQLVKERIATRSHKGDGVIVLGDFNAPWFFRPVQIVSEASLEIADTTGTTFHLNRGLNLIPAIDHVLVSDELEAHRTRVLRRRYEGVWPSDHYPVLVTLSYAGGP